MTDRITRNGIHIAKIEGGMNGTFKVGLILGRLSRFQRTPIKEADIAEKLWSDDDDLIGWAIHYPDFMVSIVVDPDECPGSKGIIDFLKWLPDGTITLTWMNHATYFLKGEVLMALDGILEPL